MKYIFYLSGDYPDIAKDEVLSLFGAKSSKTMGRILVADARGSKKSFIEGSKRLALTKSICTYLFECRNKFDYSRWKPDY